MTDETLYRSHLEALDGWLADAVERAGLGLDGVVFHAGRVRTYHADDNMVPFRQTPHFVRWVPLPGPEHCVLARPGRRPLVVRVAPTDYWHETAPLAPSYWQAAVDLVEVASFGDVGAELGPLDKVAYVGDSAEAAAELGIPGALVEPAALMSPLDWHRAIKTDHEVALVEAACRRAADGHRVARKAFEAGGSEREIHAAYLAASGQLDADNPFEPIVALGEKSAILHYQNKRTSHDGDATVFLLDAGASCEGYAADITRTWCLTAAHPVFRGLVESVDALQRELVGTVAPGRPYPEIHLETHRRVAAALVEAGVIAGTADDAIESGVTGTFLPHGVGHHLGIQVHDVGGRQAGPDGGTAAPPEGHELLRNTRTLEAGHLVTIEPGIYFIPMLLEKLRAEPAGRTVDWALVDELVGCGGIRIEDDVLCTPDGGRDLTRPLLQGPRGL